MKKSHCNISALLLPCAVSPKCNKSNFPLSSCISPPPQANNSMPGGEDHDVSWRWAKPPHEGSTCVIQALERRKTAKLSGRRGVPGRGEGLNRLEYNTDRICLSLNETSPASTSQPGSGSGVPSIQVLASKSPLWFYFLYIFFKFYFFSFSFLSLSPFLESVVLCWQAAMLMSASHFIPVCHCFQSV